MRALLPALLLVSASVMLAQTQPKQVIHPGETISIASPGLTTGDKIKVVLKPVAEPPAKKPACPDEVTLVPAQVGVQGSGQATISLGIPPNACLGAYMVTGTKQNDQTKENGGLEITSPEFVSVVQPPPEVTTISPKALFLDDGQGSGQNTSYLINFLGPNSLKADATYSLRFADYALAPCAPPDDAAGPPQNGQSCFEQNKKGSQDGQISFLLKGPSFLQNFAGKQAVSVLLNGAESARQDLIVVNASKSTPRTYALVITAALVGLIYILLSAGARALPVKSRTGSYLLTALFMDEQTQTYSLSKCQFYAWTIAAILGYIFFAVARSIIQGVAVFPDIPGGLPAILLYSAGTSVLATGITGSKGSKGAGEVHPTLADFITTGGVVAPERLQFVVWTAVGVFTFLTIVFKSDPLTVSDLPKIPDGFLQLMGISSAGYLAGKLARKAGPVIKVISVTNVNPIDYDPPGAAPVPTALTLNLQGQNLDPKATIKVGSTVLRGDLFTITPPTGQAADPQSGFCTELNVTLWDAATFVVGKHTLSLVNSDGQAADVDYPIGPMTIESVITPPQQGDTVVTGKSFVDGTQYRWYTAAGIPAGALQAAAFVSDTRLTVGRPADATHKLTLVSPKGLRVQQS